MHVSKILKNYLNWIVLSSVLIHFFVLHQGGIANWIACQHHNSPIVIESINQHKAYHHQSDTHSHTHDNQPNPEHQHENSSSHPENSVSQNKNQEVKDLNLQFLLASLTFQTLWQPSLIEIKRIKLTYQPVPVPDKPPPWSYPLLKQSTILII